MGKDRKGLVSLLIYVVAIALTFVLRLVRFVAAMWFTPGPRIEHRLPEAKFGTRTSL